MAKIDIALIQQLRERTGLGMMDCKKALEETNGDIEKAVEFFVKKGPLLPQNALIKQLLKVSCTHIFILDHKLAYSVEINCETDFVASTDAIKEFAHDVCMHIAAMKPIYLSAADVDPKFVEAEKEIIKAN